MRDIIFYLVLAIIAGLVLIGAVKLQNTISDNDCKENKGQIVTGMGKYALAHGCIYPVK